MKTNKLFKNIVWGMTLCGALCTTSCTSFDELNTDPTRMDEVNPGTLLNRFYTKHRSTTGNATTAIPTT